MANSDRQMLLQHINNAYFQGNRQSDYLIASGFVAERVRDFGELDAFQHRQNGAAIAPATKQTFDHERLTLDVHCNSTSILDFSSKHSSQTTSTSAVSDHTASTQHSPTSKEKVSGTHVSASQKRTTDDMEGEIQVLDKKGLYRSDIGSIVKSSHPPDPKTLRRLAQNREAARKSRLRKKAYVQQLESSRLKLSQIEQELGRARQQSGSLGTHAYNSALDTGAAAFNLEYAHWLEEKHRQMADLRAALQANLSEQDLQILLHSFMSHYEKIFQLKSVAVKSDVFHLLCGMWKTPAERCFIWMGGFRPSGMLKVVIPQIEPLTEQQILGIYNLQLSSQQAEDALSQGMESLQQTLAETLAAAPLGTPDNNMAAYMSQMAIAMGKLGTLESFVRQADHLRQQTLQQMQRLLTTQQMARGMIAMGEYFNCLRALSSLWSARPRE